MSGFRARRAMMSPRPDAISVARMVVTRARTGKREVFYSYDRPRWWQLGRWWRLIMHLRFMRSEDRKAGL